MAALGITRRRFLGTLAAGASVYCYARYIDPHWLDLTVTQIPLLPKGSPPFRIAQISDFHVTDEESLDRVVKSIRLVGESNPDLICVTGDFVTRKMKLREEYKAVMAAIPQIAQSIAIFGNHDGGNWAGIRGGEPDTSAVRDLLQHSGIQVLFNESLQIKHGEQSLRVVGVGDLWAEQLLPERAFPPPSPVGIREVTVLLSHNPDSKDALRDFQWDLMLSGHTHGGQLVVPLINYAPFAPVRDKRFLSGLYEWEGKRLFINRGIGSLHAMRINCRPEVSILNLVAQG